jgi:biopolymer transport protein ExbD
MRRRRNLLEREKPRLEIVPMIDIMMFLLVFFVMIVLHMIPDSGVALSLPGAATAQKLPHTQLVIAIDQAGDIHVQGQLMSPRALAGYLQNIKASTDTDVVIAGDKAVRLQQLMQVMDLARQAGVTNIGIATAPAP